EELKTNCTRVKESLSLSVGELALNSALECICLNGCFFLIYFLNLKESKRKQSLISFKSINKTEVLMALFNSLFTAQSCNLSVDGWIACRGKLYLFNSGKLNWSSSRAFCVSKGADLVTITSLTEQDFLVSKIKQTHWIGLSDLETEGHWVWVNNQTLNETGVQFWFSEGPTEPDNWKKQDPSGEDCASLGDSNGNFQSWFDASCKQKKKFICEKKNVINAASTAYLINCL
uniref:C-type lectin domain-containing protein n=1 Tax=Cyprinus carpio TaxID=7962 RepID=A0A8C2KQX2_CYPCA